MKALMRLDKKQLRTHTIVWILMILYKGLISALVTTWTLKFTSSILVHINYMIVFYSLSLFTFPKLWEKNRLLLILGILSILFIYWTNSYTIFLKILPSLGTSTIYQKKPFTYFLKSTFYFFVLAGSAGSASFFSRYGQYKLKLQGEKEKVLLIKELNFLKNQFNAQITFNFLNYCHKNIYQRLPDTAKSIKLFSNMLRYTFQTKPDERVALNNEIIYIKDFINLQKLLSAKVYVDFRHEGDFSNKYVLPRILITFVENAFKHGLGNDTEYPIAINLKVENDNLVFTVKNKINPNKATQSSNTGLENVCQILELYYTDNYKLKKEEKEGFFNVELRLGL